MAQNKLKYIVLGSYRSGTTVINESLEKHSKLKIAYEIFHPDSIHRGLPDSESIIKNLYEENNFRLTKSHFPFSVNTDVSNKISCIIDENYDLKKYVDYVFSLNNGFKILYNHLSLENKIWNYLLDNNVKFIHVLRDNFFDILVSLCAATNNKKWQRLKGDKVFEIEPFIIKKDIANYFFEMLDFLTQHFCSLIKNSDFLTIKYNEIKNWNKAINKIQFFLNLPIENIQHKYEKNIVQNKKFIVANYKELKHYFYKTKWSWFFSDEKLI
jgi:hypothetical protein